MRRIRFLHAHPLFRLTLPIDALVILSLPFAFTDLDLVISSAFYNAATGVWTLGKSTPVMLIYNYGTWPTWAAVYVSLVVLVLGLFFERERAWRRSLLFFVLAVVCGPGLLVNAYGKSHLDRPRPNDVFQPGDEAPFQRLGRFARGVDGASFPSGHASMGFIWLAPAYYFRARRLRWARRFTVLAFVHGGLLGLARVAAGGHYVSDVMWAAGADCIAAILLCIVFGLVSAARGHEEEFAYDVLGETTPVKAG